MSELRNGPAHRTIDEHLSMRVRKVLLGADDMRDLHVVIIDHYREVVSRQAVRSHDDEVAKRFFLPGDFAANQIVDRHVAVVRDMKPDGMWGAGILTGAIDPAFQIVMRRTTGGLRGLPFRFELLFRAVAAIRDAAVEQLSRGSLV